MVANLLEHVQSSTHYIPDGRVSFNSVGKLGHRAELTQQVAELDGLFLQRWRRSWQAADGRCGCAHLWKWLSVWSRTEAEGRVAR